MTPGSAPPVIGLVAVTAAGRAAAARLAAAWPGQCRLHDGPAASALPRAFAEDDGVVAFLATGATVRILAPHLGGKARDPGVVCVDEAQRYAVALLGGHGGGANDLARRVADALGAEAVVTTATDAAGLPALDELGWPVTGDVAAVSRALLDGAPVEVAHDGAVWPLPPLPTLAPGEVAARGDCRLPADVERPDRHERAGGTAAGRTPAPGSSATAGRILVTDRVPPDQPPVEVPTVLVHPPSLVVGLGASRGVKAEEVLALVDRTLADAGLSPHSVTAAATVDAKADETGLVEACARRGWPLTAYARDVLGAVDVPHPSEHVRAALGIDSVAEAAAITAAGDGGGLVVGKTRSAMATVAVARRRPRGRLALVGLGPGARDLVTPRAVAELRRSSVWVGLDQYLDQVRDLARPGTAFEATGLGDEEARARRAVELARRGHAVALVGSGDAGVYAMASPALLHEDTDGIDVVGVPGVTAALAASSLLGAPLGHDHCNVSLSDLHTPWEVIERRVRAAATGDFVVTFYNPRSRGRTAQLPAALDLLREHRPATTPVGLVRDASRPGERVLLTTLADVDPADVDMVTVVVVGSTQTRVVAGRMVTPRGYRWAP